MPKRGIIFGVSVELTEADIVAVKFFYNNLVQYSDGVNLIVHSAVIVANHLLSNVKLQYLP